MLPGTDRARLLPSARRLGAARAAIGVAACLAVWAPRPASSAGLVAVRLEEVAERIERVQWALTARGLELHVESYAVLPLPVPAQELEVEGEADGPLLLTWAARVAEKPRLYGPPWRYTKVPLGRSTLRLDLRTTADWTPTAQPVLVLKGTGTFVVRALRARPALLTAEGRAAFDRALLWAPESIGHATINTLTPSFWSASRGRWLSDVVAGAALAVLVAVLLVSRLRGRPVAPGRALALAGLVALALWDAHFLARFLPVANLRFEPDREARLRRNYYFDAELGELSALARATLGPRERVGTMAGPKDWFGPQTLCLNLAPRPCAIMKPGQEVHAGLSGVGRLRTAELDAIVSFHGGPLPDGFVPVAAITHQALVARPR